MLYLQHVGAPSQPKNLFSFFMHGTVAFFLIEGCRFVRAARARAVGLGIEILQSGAQKIKIVYKR